MIKEPSLATHHAALPSWSGYHFVWYPDMNMPSHLMSKRAATNLSRCFEGSSVHKHSGAPQRFGGIGRVLRSLKKTIAPEPMTLIRFQCNGCMAQDWREMDRGVIVDKINRTVYGSGLNGCDYYVVERPDGSRFECYAGYCQPGLQEMQARTDNPDESLVGKMVCTE